LELSCPPNEFVWGEDLKAEPIKLKTKDLANPKTLTLEEDMEDLQAAFEDLSRMVVDAMQGSRDDVMEVLKYISISVVNLVSAINRLNYRGWRWKSLIRDISTLHEDSGIYDLTLVGAIAQVMTPQDSGAAASIIELNELCKAIDSDLVRNLRLLNKKIKGLERQRSALTLSPPQAAVSALTLDTPILDANGNQIGTLGSMVDKNAALKTANAKLMDRVDRLVADVTAQGGAVLGRHTFTSELQVRALAMMECSSGDAFLVFVDLMTLFCHNVMYFLVTGWEKTTKAMEELGTLLVTDRKVVASYNLQHLLWFMEGKPVVAGKVINAFSLMEKWQGSGGLDGKRVEIEVLAKTAADGVRTAITNTLPDGSQLAQLALRMLEHTQSWLLMVNKHLDAELTKLTQMHITVEEALILLSEEIIIMFDQFYAIRCKRMEFTVKGTRVEYMVWCIWLTLQVQAMDDFTRDGMKYNPAISAAFVWEQRIPV
jgi:hypothetical protein